MKRWTLWVAAATLTVGAAMTAVVAQESASKEATITGEVVDLKCYVAAGAKGPGHKGCATGCIKGGGPAGILEDKTDKLYIVVAAKPGGNPAEKLMDHIAAHVTVTGPVGMRGGVHTIVVNTVKAAQ